MVASTKNLEARTWWASCGAAGPRSFWCCEWLVVGYSRLFFWWASLVFKWGFSQDRFKVPYLSPLTANTASAKQKSPVGQLMSKPWWKVSTISSIGERINCIKSPWKRVMTVGCHFSDRGGWSLWRCQACHILANDSVTSWYRKMPKMVRISEGWEEDVRVAIFTMEHQWSMLIWGVWWTMLASNSAKFNDFWVGL